MTYFDGFPRELLTFFNQLKKNNTREWFDSHREDYETFVKQPAAEFVLSMGERLKEIAPGINVIPRVNQSLFRLNRERASAGTKAPIRRIWASGSGREREREWNVQDFIFTVKMEYLC